ncbi:MAG TPA: hypothetical protein VE172_20395 [Stackebrandtia sp.]|jgi:hypothetical protein|uniref:hypothetical protein n=1 Tax=Stackebrandtia sp. TaxID=2023065 RepID=UPI002D3E64F2|nr:hypothetical protein [Stackebrandtia sp.]HZE41166.1 hypothetical protein [Stackebrandtia sp.]
MRTTVNLDEDVLAIVEHVRREMHVGVSEALNTLVRAGSAAGGRRAERFSQRTMSLGKPRIDLTNTAEVLDYLDGDEIAR